MDSDTLAVTIALVGAVGPTLVGSAAWVAARNARKNTETGNGQVLGAYVVSVDKKVDQALVRLDEIDDKNDHRAERIIRLAAAHDQRDRQAFRAAGLPYPDPDPEPEAEHVHVTDDDGGRAADDTKENAR